jgi:hypothetical protein
MKRIDVLPDDVLLEIFDFHVKQCPVLPVKMDVDAWQSLVHVCRRWRSLVLGSPRRLNLRLFCTPKTRARDTLDIWPALPLIVKWNMALSSGTDNVIAALGQSNRVCEVTLWGLEGGEMEKVLAAMQVPFPELRALQLYSKGMPVIPDSFLDGSAPHLQYFELNGIPFPGLPKLLSSANHLVTLWLDNIPHSGYISPEAIVALISVLSSLESLGLEFRSHHDRESPSLPPPKRFILPTLHEFRFKGVTGYLEELVISIDAPQLNEMCITFFNQIDFDCPQLVQFINRTPTLRELDEAHVQFRNGTPSVKLRCRTSKFGFYNIRINIPGGEQDWQLSSIEQVCNSSLYPLSAVEDLCIERRFEYPQLVWKNDAVENTLWLQLLLPYTAVKNLYLFEEFAPGIAAALQELVGARITEVLPSLQNIFVEGLEPSGPFQKNFGQFVAARQLSGHPIAISDWD